MCRPISAKHFPGGILYAVKARNEVKSAEALLHKLGYTPVTPSGDKILKVLTTATTGVGKSECKLHPLSESERLDYKGFRTACVLALPKINPQSERPMKDQLGEKPLGDLSKMTMDAFRDGKMPEVVNALNLAYAIIKTIEKPKSPSCAEYYRQTRGALVNSTHAVKLTDALGNVYPTVDDIPAPILGYLRKQFNYPELKRKRPEEETPMDVENPMPTPAGGKGKEKAVDAAPQEVADPGEAEAPMDLARESPAQATSITRETVPPTKKAKVGPRYDSLVATADAPQGFVRRVTTEGGSQAASVADARRSFRAQARETAKSLGQTPRR